MDNNAISKAAKAQTAPAANGGAVAKANATPPSPKVYISNLLAKQADAIKAALPAVMTPERFSRIALTAINGNPKLQEAVVKSPMTFLGALMTSAQLGLEPNTPMGKAYLIPYNNSKKVNGQYVKCLETSFQIGVRGLVDLARRSGEIAEIYAEVVYENDPKFEYQLGLNKNLVHIPSMGDRGKAVAYYAVYKTKDGASDFKVMSRDEVLKHAKRFSKSFNKEKNSFTGPWQTDFDAMAKVTVLKAVLKYAPMATDVISNVIASDTAVRSELTQDMVTAPREDSIIYGEASVEEAETTENEEDNTQEE